MEWVILGICTAILLFLWVIGAPIFLAFLAASIFFIALTPTLSLMVIPEQIFAHVDSWILIAIPLFILAGQIMAYTGSARYMVDSLDSFVGGIPGGLWIASVAASLFFGTMCGSGPATTTTIGSIMLGPLQEKGYRRDVSMGLIACCGSLGNLIPPAIGLIVIGAVAQLDIGVLFMGALLPGLLIGGALAIEAFLIAQWRGYKGSHHSWKERGELTFKAIPAFASPMIILGGIYGGVLTPTEAASIACVWSVVLAFIYRQAGRTQLRRALYETVRISASLYILIGSVLVFSLIILYFKIPQALTTWVVAVELSPKVFLGACWLLWMILGCFLDATPITLVSIPALFPTAIAMGINPIHFAILMQACITAGQATPPFAINLFAISATAKAPIEESYRGALPFCFTSYAAILILLLFPEIVLSLPRLLGAL